MVLPLKWVDDHYEESEGRTIGVELPIFVTARVTKTKTDDGLVEREGHIQVGEKYEMRVNSMGMNEWGHIAHPGKTWQRRTATFRGENGFIERLPIELFDVEMN